MTAKENISLSTTIRDDFLTCKICFNIYEQPKILPCVHTYCCPCLEKLASTSEKPGSVSCPECRECVDLPHNNVSDLKTNFLINSLIEVLKVKTNKDVKCTTCDLRGKSSPAESRCLDCGDYLCASCSDGHNASSATWNHNTVLLEDIKTGSYDEQLRNISKLTCIKHKGKQIEYFCEKCQTPICLTCVLLLHRGHKCISVSDAVKESKKRLAKHMKKVKEKLIQLETEQKIARDTLASENKYKTEAVVSTEQQITNILAKVELHREKTVMMIDSMLKDEIQHRKKQLEDKTAKITLLKDCLQFCERMREQGQDDEVLFLADTVNQHLQKVEESLCSEWEPTVKDVIADTNIEEPQPFQDVQFLNRNHDDEEDLLNINTEDVNSDNDAGELTTAERLPDTDRNKTHRVQGVLSLAGGVAERELTTKESLLYTDRNKTLSVQGVQSLAGNLAERELTTEERLPDFDKTLSVQGVQSLAGDIAERELTTEERLPDFDKTHSVQGVQRLLGSQTEEGSSEENKMLYSDAVQIRCEQTSECSGENQLDDFLYESDILWSVNKSVTFELLRAFDTKYRTDNKCPDVKGMTMHNDIIYISDNANGTIKCFSKLGVLKECLIPEQEDSFSPYAVAICNNVVGAISENHLYLFDKNRQSLIKVVLGEKWDSYCGLQFTYPLANYKNEGFIVGNLPNIHFKLYNTSGILLKQLIMPHLLPLANLSLCKRGFFVTCEWEDNSVRVRNTEGKTITYCQVGTWKPNAAHVDSHGHLFAVDTFADTVFVFDKNGNLLHKYSTKRDGLFKPRTIAFDDEGLMYVVNTNGKICVYRISVKAKNK